MIETTRCIASYARKEKKEDTMGYEATDNKGYEVMDTEEYEVRDTAGFEVMDTEGYEATDTEDTPKLKARHGRALCCTG